MNSVVIAMLVLVGTGLIAMAMVAIIGAAIPIIGPQASLLWTAEASGRAEESGSSGSSVSRSSRGYQPVDRAPDILCGCTEVLKNFA